MNSLFEKKWLITFTVMSVAVLEVLDMTIVNVALPNMMGSLGANADQITWILTSYIVSSAICMPLTGFLVNRVGRKRLLLINIIGFMLSSAFSGMSVSLGQIVFFRTLQGVFGATLVPLSQYILRDTFPLEEQGKAMAIWGIGIMVGPIMGPTIGGYITDAFNWRWIFYLNIPICILAGFLTLKFIPETKRIKEQVDWFGLALMSIGIGSLQIVLDRGNQENWFSSDSIILLSLLCIYTLSFFIYRGFTQSNTIINLKLFFDRNFAISTFLLTLYCITIFSVLTLQPIMLENLFSYPVNTTGLYMAPRGLSCALSMVIVAKIINRVDVRHILCAGLLFSIFGTYLMVRESLNTSGFDIMFSGAIQGFGMGLFFVPISTLSLSSLAQKDLAEGSGLFSFGRSLGSSIGISLFSTLLTNESQINWNRLNSHLQMQNPGMSNWLFAHHLILSSPKTPHYLANQLLQQATMIAFIDCYWLAMLGLVCMIPMVFMLKKVDFNPKFALGH